MWEMPGEEEELNPDFRVQVSVVSDIRFETAVYAVNRVSG